MEVTTKINIDEKNIERKVNKIVNDYLVRFVSDELDEIVRRKVEAIVSTRRLEDRLDEAITDKILEVVTRQSFSRIMELIHAAEKKDYYYSYYEDTEFSEALKTGFAIAEALGNEESYEKIIDSAGKHLAVNTRRDSYKYRKIAEALKEAYEKEEDNED